MTMRTFRRLFPPAVPAEGSAFWLLFHGADLLMPTDGAPALLVGTAAALDGLEVGESFLLGTLDGRPLLVGVLPDDVAGRSQRARHRAAKLRRANFCMDFRRQPPAARC